MRFRSPWAGASQFCVYVPRFSTPCNHMSHGTSNIWHLVTVQTATCEPVGSKAADHVLAPLGSHLACVLGTQSRLLLLAGFITQACLCPPKTGRAKPIKSA